MDFYEHKNESGAPEQMGTTPQQPVNDTQNNAQYTQAPQEQAPQHTAYQTTVRYSDERTGSSTSGQTPPVFEHEPSGGPFAKNEQQYTTYQQWQQQEAKKNQKEKKPHSRKPLFAVGAVAAAAVIFVAGLGIGGAFTGGNAQTTPTSGGSQSSAYDSSLPTLEISNTPAETVSSTSGGILDGSAIYEKVNDSIVAIQVSSLQTSSSASGSGVIMSSDGYIITNAHVVTDENTGAEMDKVTVQFSDGSQLPAAIIGVDEQTDLAVIKVEPEEPLTPAEFGDSDQLKVGQTAYAIGSPGGLQLANSMTDGIISAINRDITVNDRVMSLIQTSVTINPGNSGGALINQYGQVVGITSAKLGISYYEGLGFAIPINSAKEIVDELIQYGYVSGRPSIGITGQNLSAEVAEYNGVPQGVLVASVDSRAYAAQEGLQQKDIIIAVDGQSITTMDEINEIKGDKKAGEKLTLTVYRMSTGKTLDIEVTLTDAHDLEGTDPALQQNNDTTQEDSQNSQYYYNNPFSWFFNY